MQEKNRGDDVSTCINVTMYPPVQLLYANTKINKQIKPKKKKEEEEELEAQDLIRKHRLLAGKEEGRKNKPGRNEPVCNKCYLPSLSLSAS
jgi:hypothetical protein